MLVVRILEDITLSQLITTDVIEGYGSTERGGGKERISPAALRLPGLKSQAAVYAMMFSVTSILPRVALEYGQTICAASTSFLASAASIPSTWMFSFASIPKPVGSGPIPTSPSIKASFGRANLSRAATNFIAPRKQAE